MDYTTSEHLIPVFDFGVLHLELNTALFVFALVLIVMFAMNRLLFKPVLRSIDKREALLGELQAQVQARREESEKLDADYHARMAEVREEVNRYRQETRRKAQQEVDAILAEAREVAAKELETALAQLHQEVAQIRGELTAGLEGFAEKITTKVLEN